jgi:periplasmic copper chaperone A
VITPWRRLGVGVVTLALASVSWLSGASAAPAVGSASHGGMQVTGAFLPLPPSPSVASAYLVFHNLTGRADTLLSAGTSVASQTMPMSEGATSMKMLGPVTIPPHGRVVFTPGHDHLMLQGLRRRLKVGESVEVRLRFRHAGTIDLKVPVVPLNRILGLQSGKGASKAGASSTTMGHMAGM